MFFYKSATYFGEEQGVEQRYGQETQWHNLNETAEGYYMLRMLSSYQEYQGYNFSLLKIV